MLTIIGLCSIGQISEFFSNNLFGVLWDLWLKHFFFSIVLPMSLKLAGQEFVVPLTQFNWPHEANGELVSVQRNR